MNLRFVQGLLFIKCALRKIDITKKLFILDLEQGSEVYLNNVLN